MKMTKTKIFLEKKEKNSLRLIKKSNELVEARYKFDIWETRMFAKTLSMIHHDDIDFQEYKISVGEVIEEFGLSKGGEIYEFLKQATLRLQDKKITIQRERDGLKTEFSTPLFTGVERVIDKNIKESEKYLWVSFHPNLKPYLLELKNRYLIYDIRSILTFKSVNTIRIYELLKQYEKIGERIFSIDELKQILGILPNEYILYGHFKNKIILKAQNDLYENIDCDINFTLQELKENRKVEKLKFIIHKRNTQIKESIDSSSKKADSNVLKILNILSNTVASDIVAHWLDRYSSEVVLKAALYTRTRINAGEKIKNVAAYVSKLISLPSISMTYADNTINEITKHNVDEEEIAFLEKQLDTLHKKYLEVQSNLLKKIFDANPNVLREIIENIKNSNDYNHNISEAENLERESIKALIVVKAMQKYPETFEGLYKKYENNVMQLKKRLRKLGWHG